MPFRRHRYHCHHCAHHGSCSHCRPRRRDTAGTVLIAFFVVLLIVGLSKPSTQPAADSPVSPVAPVLVHPEQVAQAPEDPAADPERPRVEPVPAPPEDPPCDKDECETPVPSDQAPVGCAAVACRTEFARYSIAPAGKAFVVGTGGQGFWDGGEDSVSEAVRKALDLCAESTCGGSCSVALVAGR